MANSRITKQLIAGFAATMSLAGTGFQFGWSSPSLPKLLAEDSDIRVTSDEGSWIVSVFTIGCALGSLIGALLVDRCGRKWMLLSTVIPHLIGSIFIGFARSVWWLICGRRFLVSDLHTSSRVQCVFYTIKMTKSKITTQLIAGFAATMSTAGAGFGFGWPSPSLPIIQAPESEITVTSSQGSWIVSVFTIGSAIGSLVGALLVDRYDRKNLLLATMIPYLLASILIGFAQNLWWFISARTIAGLGTGMAYAIVPMYAGEIADDRIRGAISGMLDPVVNVSVVITYCIGPWVSFRELAILGGALPLVFGLMFAWVPESPYFLIMKDRPDQARKSLEWLRGMSDVSEELKMIQENVAAEQKNAGTIMDLVLIPGNRKALIIIVGIIVAQQLSGIPAVVSYSSLIFRASGSVLDPSLSVIIFGAFQLFAGVMTVFTADWAGRRLLMLISTCGSVLFLGALALYFQLQANGTDVSSIFWLPVTAMVGFIVICTIGLGALPYVILSEIFPCNVKAAATTVVNISGSVVVVIVTKLYQIITDAYGIHISLWGFAGASIGSIMFIYFILPETKQRSLQDIQNELHKITESKMVLSKLDD